MKPFIAIDIQDKVYHLRLTLKVILEYEQLTNYKFCEFNISDYGKMLCLLWLMMKREQQELTLIKVSQIVSKTKNKQELFNAIKEAIINSFSINNNSQQIENEIKNENPQYFNIDSYMRRAIQIGMSFDSIMELTPAEFEEIQKQYIKNIKREHNDLYTLAWHTAYFNRVNKMPNINKFLVNIEYETTPKKEMTGEEMMSMCQYLCSAFGGKVVEI